MGGKREGKKEALGPGLTSSDLESGIPGLRVDKSTSGRQVGCFR